MALVFSVKMLYIYKQKKSSGKAGQPASPLHFAERRKPPNVRAAGSVRTPAVGAGAPGTPPSLRRRCGLALTAMRWGLPGRLAALRAHPASPLLRLGGGGRSQGGGAPRTGRASPGGGGGLTRGLGWERCQASQAPVGRQGLQELRGGAEAHLLLPLGQQRGQRASPLAAGLAAQLLVARDGAVARQDLHLAEYGLVPRAGFICGHRHWLRSHI